MKRLFALRGSSLARLALAAAVAGCGDGIDLTPTSSGTGTSTGGSGAGGAGGFTTTPGQGGGPTTSTTEPEPSGPTRLTVINGINDYGAIRVCFMPYPDGPAVEPWPPSAAGLAYARAAQIDPPGSVAPGGADVQPHVIAGDLSVIAGMSCDEALAFAESTAGSGGAGGGGGAGGAPEPPPPIVVRPMPLIPGSVFSEDKSLLLVFFGCIGGPGHADGTEGLGCGFDYTLDSPTASLTLVAMSRKKDPGAVTLQFVHAAPPMQPSDIGITPGYDNPMDTKVVKSIGLGGLGPKPPFMDFERADFGPLAKVQIRTYAPNDINVQSAVLLQDAFVNGGVADTDFLDGSSFTIAAVGGYPGVMIPSFWQPFTWVMVPSDPP